MKNIGIFCGSSMGNLPIYRQAAEELTDLMITAGTSLIYGGAKIGLMGVIADRMIKCGAQVIGVIPKDLTTVEVVHNNLTNLHIVNSMHERKKLISELADCFIMLPGGIGSLDEFFEIFTWAKLQYHFKPIGILNTNGYYNQLLNFLDHTVSQGFLKEKDRNRLIVSQSARHLMNQLNKVQA